MAASGWRHVTHSRTSAAVEVLGQGRVLRWMKVDQAAQSLNLHMNLLPCTTTYDSSNGKTRRPELLQHSANTVRSALLQQRAISRHRSARIRATRG